MRQLPFSLLCATLVIQLSADAILAQIPETISFQGHIESSGEPVTDSLDLTFTIYNQLDNPIWFTTESNVPVVDGLFSVILGPFDNIVFDEAHSVGVQVESDAEINPKISLTAAPYALGVRHMRIYPGDRPSIVAGSYSNVRSADAVGVTISGGGRPDDSIFNTSCIAQGDVNRNTAGASFSTIGGGYGNYACLSATVGGGQGNKASGSQSTVGGGEDNSAIGARATVAGGVDNTAGGSGSSIGGGGSNSADGTGSFIGGGQQNSTAGEYAFIGGGLLNLANATKATLGGGESNLVTGEFSTIGGGYNNGIAGDYSVVPGGFSNDANGSYAFAAGQRAQASHAGTFVWADSANSVGTDFESTGTNQFLVRARGGVGIGTNAPEEQLHIIESGGSTGIKLGGDGTLGPNGIVFEDDTDNNGVQLFWRTANDEFVLEKSSQGTGTDGEDLFLYDRQDDEFRFNKRVGVGTSNPITQFHVVRNISASASTGNHVALIDNSSTGNSADVLALRVARVDSPGTSNAYISFRYASNSSAGFIRGNGNGGVELSTSGADYAEYLEKIIPAEQLDPGDVVGIFGGRVTHKTAGADQVMVVSTAPIIVGNNHHLTEDEDYRFARIAFIGQAPVSVRGPVAEGDLLIPSGMSDGTARAIDPTEIRPDQLRSVFGTAWESSDVTGIHKVNAAIGIDQTAATTRVIEALHDRQAETTEAIRLLTQRLGVIEALLVN